MWRGFPLKKRFRRGVYNPLPEESDGKDGETSPPNLNDRDPRPYFLGLKLMLAAFCGFIFAIILVNLFPGEMVRSGETKLQKLLHGMALFDREKWKLMNTVPDETVIFRQIPMFEEAPADDSDLAWEALLGRE